ncbi:MAG: hypothetical protein JNM76_18240 [Betaproteobacteria bacterium]|nr:hypothetical protein [Betaproteobacteria bacterium]
MNIDRLRDAWRAQDSALQGHLKVNDRKLRELMVAEHGKDLHRKGWLANLEIIVWLPSVFLITAFNATHWGWWEFLIPGLLLQLWITFIPFVSIRQRAKLRAVDFSQPVLSLQREIERLKMQRMTMLKWAFLIGQVIWYVPFLIVFFKGVFDVNLYLMPNWIESFMWINIAGGLAFIPIAVLLSRWLGPRLNALPKFRAFTDNLAGRDMLAAQAFLERVRQFEQDGEQGSKQDGG